MTDKIATDTADMADYDAGLLNHFGGGDVEWWQDYLRAELGRANDFWRDQAADALSALQAENERLRGDLRDERINHIAAREWVGRLLAERDRLQAVVRRWESYGCPHCGGDCASANPPVICCIMQETSAALTHPTGDTTNGV